MKLFGFGKQDEKLYNLSNLYWVIYKKGEEVIALPVDMSKDKLYFIDIVNGKTYKRAGYKKSYDSRGKVRGVDCLNGLPYDFVNDHKKMGVIIDSFAGFKLESGLGCPLCTKKKCGSFTNSSGAEEYYSKLNVNERELVSICELYSAEVKKMLFHNSNKGGVSKDSSKYTNLSKEFLLEDIVWCVFTKENGHKDIEPYVYLYGGFAKLKNIENGNVLSRDDFVLAKDNSLKLFIPYYENKSVNSVIKGIEILSVLKNCKVNPDLLGLKNDKSVLTTYDVENICDLARKKFSNRETDKQL